MMAFSTFTTNLPMESIKKINKLPQDICSTKNMVCNIGTILVIILEQNCLKL